jgi:hypothetical protein
MLKFCGFDLELNIDTVLQRQGDHLTVLSATDPAGDHWLIVETGSNTHETTWVCAPASDRALELVAAGRAAASDAVRHSSTGWVEVVRLVDGHAVPDERVACSRLNGERGTAPTDAMV